MKTKGLKVWIEISKSALESNVKALRSHLAPETQLWAVVKSNAYGHGLFTFSPLAQEYGVDGFCVDSVIEGATLRRHGITKPILSLGPTLSTLYRAAVKNDIAVTISTWEALKALARLKSRPLIHLKVETGMHRQGFEPAELQKVFTFCAEKKVTIAGIYSHFAASKNPADTSFNQHQLGQYEQALNFANEAGQTHLIRHLAGTPATLLDQRYHFDLVRIGSGIYGIYPSPAIEAIVGRTIKLQPVLSLKSHISELKKVAAGESVGYERSEKLTRETEIAIIPIGYWHGVPRAASSKGHVLIRGKQARVLGIISMDLMAVDATGLGAKVGDTVTVIGKDGDQELKLVDLATASSTTQIEIVSRLNPLIERVIV